MEILVPELGESIVEATVARWLKKEGDPVSVGEPVVELETDKVDLEVGAKEDGILKKITHQEGEDVKVGETLGVIEPSSEASVQPAQAPQPDSDQEKPAQESTQPAEAPKTQPQPGNGSGTERVTPVAKRIAQEQGVDLSQVEASGTGDRITKEDVQRYLNQVKAAPTEREVTKEKAPEPENAPPKAPQPSPEIPEEAAYAPRREIRQRLSRRRRTIASRLVEAQRNAAMLTTFNDVDMSAVMEIRSRRKETFQERHGVRLGFMSFFIKASIGALKEFPRINAEIQEDEVVLKQYYDIGVAIGAEEGLVVPVLRDADRMSFAEIESTIRAYIDKSQQGNLSLEDLRGGTFTITNGGVFGSLLSTPILNPPQVAILGLHRIEERPVAVNGQVVIRPMMYVALSYDHRIVDGREAVQFLVRLKELIQDPETLLLEG